MRMLLPPLKERRVIQARLSEFFRTHRTSEFHRAIAAIAGFYELDTPRVDWFEYIDWGRTVGRTYENGTIHLVHPENWKRGRKYNSEEQWINAVYHEMGHYVFWADAERKANLFAEKMERNVRRKILLGETRATSRHVGGIRRGGERSDGLTVGRTMATPERGRRARA
jgi:hypothetical protein